SYSGAFPESRSSEGRPNGSIRQGRNQTHNTITRRRGRHSVPAGRRRSTPGALCEKRIGVEEGVLRLSLRRFVRAGEVFPSGLHSTTSRSTEVGSSEVGPKGHRFDKLGSGPRGERM